MSSYDLKRLETAIQYIRRILTESEAIRERKRREKKSDAAPRSTLPNQK